MSAAIESSRSTIEAYLTLRKMIGYLGIIFPIILLLGNLIVFNAGMQSALSGYYHSAMRDVFVGILFAVGFFFFSYKGYDKKDDIVGDIAGVLAIGIALFPTNTDCKLEFSCPSDTIANIHIAFAVLYFCTLAYICLFLFTKTAPNKKPTANKIRRNKVYRICGGVMLVCMALMAAHIVTYKMSGTKYFAGYHPIFWLEALANFAFGLSWLIKGEAMLKDDHSAAEVKN